MKLLETSSRAVDQYNQRAVQSLYMPVNPGQYLHRMDVSEPADDEIIDRNKIARYQCCGRPTAGDLFIL